MTEMTGLGFTWYPSTKYQSSSSFSEEEVANFGSDVTLDVQSIFDEICPCMLPLAATFIVYKLLKKGVKAYWIMLGIIAVGIVGKFFGIL